MFTYELTDIRLNEKGLYATLRSQRSPVARYIRLLGEETVVVAKGLAGVKTGRLKRSIKMTRDRNLGVEYSVLVGSDVRHALVHHMGARPHVIRPQNPSGYLKFRSGSGVVYAKSVKHPGHGPNRYLTEALRAVVKR